MAADGHEVDVEVVDVDGDFADRLRSVRVEEDLLGPAQLADLLQWLYDTCRTIQVLRRGCQS